MEIWKNISELGIIKDGNGKLVDMSVYNNYEISNMGRVKSLNYHRSGKPHIMKGTPNIDGYLKVDLLYNGKRKSFLIHRLVAYAFIEKPNNLNEINHIDENKSNNTTKNLEWVTPKQNCNHATRNQRMVETSKTSEKVKQGHKRSAQKLSKQVYQYDLDYNLVRIYSSITEAGNIGFNQSHIASCCRGERKTHKGFIFSYIPFRKTTIRKCFFGALSINTWKLKKVG